MSEVLPGSNGRETTAMNLFVHQLVLDAIAELVTPYESAEITRKLGERLESNKAALMRIYWNNQGATMAPRIAAGLQHVIDGLPAAPNLQAVVNILAQMSQD